MKRFGIAVIATLFFLGFAGQAAAADKCTFNAGAGIDALSPSQLGSLSCETSIKDGKGGVQTRNYAVFAVWGSDPYSTGAAARVILQLRDKASGTQFNIDTTTGWVAKTEVKGTLTDPKSTVTLNDVAGAWNGSVFTINFKYVVGGISQAVPFKVGDLLTKVP